ncbi:unnamed protein product [Cuscuta europaea]|uniref:WLM domain-containing protein n=1 Tax=Cuscuta europaea TaxID=41803 RepID=A0A9P0YJ54_CUSEU|nr:unnamed protein product [Cuscuta europaea]
MPSFCNIPASQLIYSLYPGEGRYPVNRTRSLKQFTRVELHRAIDLSVTWRGKKFFPKMDPRTTFKALGDELLKLTNVEDDTMRLIVPTNKSSKLIYPFSEEHSYLKLDEASIIEGKSLRMLGVPKDEVDEVIKRANEDLRIVGFEEEEQRLRQRSAYRVQTSLKVPQGHYIFCDFRTLHLPGVELNPPPSEALKLMHKLSADPGIVAIMNKHRWRVGIMTEMAPIGYVGVSPKCILGFNKSQGEEISLRLRTDNLRGFRKYHIIKKTLLHELAHMVHSEHDANFYALDKQLNEEAAILDWTKSRSHTLSGLQHAQSYEDDMFDIPIPSAQKLGGKSLSSDARVSSVTAAVQRFAANQTREIEGSNHMDVEQENEPAISTIDHVPEYTRVLPHLEDMEHEETERDDDSERVIINTDGVEAMHENQVCDVSDPDRSQEKSVRLTEQDLDDKRAMLRTVPSNHIDEPDPDDPELLRIRDPVDMVCSNLRRAVEQLKAQASPVDAACILQTLIKIIKNMIEYPYEVKFKKLRKANPIIKRDLLNYKAAMDILVLIGFKEDVLTDEMGRREDCLFLKRDDPGLLWLAKSSLEAYIA